MQKNLTPIFSFMLQRIFICCIVWSLGLVSPSVFAKSHNGLPMRCDEAPPAAVNYVPTHIAFSSEPVSCGDSLTIEAYGFTNEGPDNESSRPFYVGFYLSEDEIIHPSGDRYIGSFTTEGPRAGESETGSISLSVPADMDAGTYYLGIYVDKTDRISETDEEDNGLRAEESLIIMCAEKDAINYAPTRIAFSSEPVSCGDKLIIDEYSFVNEGPDNESSRPFYVGFYLSEDEIIHPSGDRYIGSFTTEGPRAGEAETGSISLSVPADMAAGTYYLGIYVDKTDRISETDEEDNGLRADETLRICCGDDCSQTT
ncbi:MAG: hypothetical protein GY850_31795, partial [bacterium]|nr:hypothetical protein [bacterium]